MSDNVPTVVCLYMGPIDECIGCGGYSAMGTRFCSHDCADVYDQRGREANARTQARRDEEDAYAQRVAELRALGHTYEECDRIIADGTT